jgi:hypothetical protein
MDVDVILLEPLPWRLKIKGEEWSASIWPMNKSGKQVALVFQCSAPGGRSYTLWRSRDVMVRDLYVTGFRVKAGTPERGIVTELRRRGLVELRERPPRL